MIESTLNQAAEFMQGQLSGSDRPFRGVSTDTRTIQPGELFFALEGPNFDGGKFVDAAMEQQAAGAVVPRDCDSEFAHIAVDDTLAALGRLAAHWRSQVTATVVGVTGSNGKTTLRELIAACLAQASDTFATHGNLNNEIGMPLTILRLSKSDRYAVIEMGANHAGEIAYLTDIARPEAVVITNAAPAHLEGFGSLDGVARAKGEILQHEQRPRFAVLNADDAYFSYWKSLVEDIDLLSFGIENEATVHASGIEAHAGGSHFTLHLPDAQTDVDLPLAGAHNVMNACAAAAVAYGLGIQADAIRAGLESIVPVAGRLQPIEGIGGCTLYDDSYNANPASVTAAAQFLAAEEGEGVLVLADMKELGPDAEQMHAEVGQAAAEAGVDRLLATGDLSRYAVDAFGDGGAWFADIEELIAAATDIAGSDCNVLVKGSRSMRMERVVDALRAGGED